VTFIIGGAAILALILTGMFLLVASAAGWRFAAVTFAIAVGVTALAAIGSMLIGYGIEGHL